MDLNLVKHNGSEDSLSDMDSESIELNIKKHKNEMKPRMKWGQQREFILTMLGSAIGLGNIWRFPYLCFKYGGGAFLIPYFIFLFLGGIPTMVLEISLGQFMARGGVEAWQIAPIFKGVGFSCLVLVLWINIYYGVIISWTLYYFIKTVFGETTWTDCGQTWNTDCCSKDFLNGTLVIPENCVTSENVTGEPKFPEEEFWYHNVLNLSDGIGTMGGLQWEITGCLVVIWLVTYMCIYNGAKSTGKAAYFTSTFPLLMLIILVIKGLSLEGAMDGVRYLFYPDLEKLYDAEVWSMAGSQVLFSYVSGQGVLTSLGSFNKFNFNVFKWSCMLCITNFLASMMAGVAIFSVLGNMAYEVGVNVRDVAQGGPGLAFIVYPRALSNLPMPTLWYILFFGMILLLGVSSQNAEVESMVTMLVDLKPRFFNANRRRRPLFVLFVCLTCFCCALIMTSQGGMYLFQLCDSYGASGISLLIIVLFENVAVGWIYGRKRFYEDMFFMFGHKMDPRKSIWPVLGYIWQFVTPVLISAVLGYAFTNWKSPTFERYDGVYEYPPMGVAIALLMTMSSAICIPVYFIYLFLKTKTRNITVLQTLKKMMVPIYPDDHPYHELNSSRESSCTDSRTDASSKILM